MPSTFPMSRPAAIPHRRCHGNARSGKVGNLLTATNIERRAASIRPVEAKLLPSLWIGCLHQDFIHEILRRRKLSSCVLRYIGVSP